MIPIKTHPAAVITCVVVVVVNWVVLTIVVCATVVMFRRVGALLIVIRIPPGILTTVFVSKNSLIIIGCSLTSKDMMS